MQRWNKIVTRPSQSPDATIVKDRPSTGTSVSHRSVSDHACISFRSLSTDGVSGKALDSPAGIDDEIFFFTDVDFAERTAVNSDDDDQQSVATMRDEEDHLNEIVLTLVMVLNMDTSYVLRTMYRVNDVTALSLGIFFNTLLCYTIFKLRKVYKSAYTQLFLVSSIFDLTIGIEEILIQHQPHVKNGVMYVMGHGIEHLFPKDTFPYLMFPHAFLTIHGVMILAVQYHHRYVIMSGRGNNNKQLYIDLAISVSCGLLTATFLTLGSYQSQEVPWHVWKERISDDWFGEEGARMFVYASDLSYSGTKLYFTFGLIFSSLTILLVCIYAYKAWKFVNPRAEVSTRTKRMQAQFTWTLIVQTINAVCFAILPITLNVCLVLFQLPGDKIYSAVVMPLISWLPAANGFMTLYVVREFRAFALKSLKMNRIGTYSTSSSNNKSFSMPKISVIMRSKIGLTRHQDLTNTQTS